MGFWFRGHVFFLPIFNPYGIEVWICIFYDYQYLISTRLVWFCFFLLRLPIFNFNGIEVWISISFYDKQYLISTGLRSGFVFFYDYQYLISIRLGFGKIYVAKYKIKIAFINTYKLNIQLINIVST